jgi:hypothetical protein
MADDREVPPRHRGCLEEVEWNVADREFFDLIPIGIRAHEQGRSSRLGDSNPGASRSSQLPLKDLRNSSIGESVNSQYLDVLP